MLLRNFKMAISSIGHAKTRSFLTMLGIIIGVSSVMTVLAAGEGIKQQIVGESERLGANLINITPGQSFTEDGGFNIAASLGVSTLSEEDVQTIRDIETVETAAPIMLISGTPSYNEQAARSATIMSTTPELAEVLQLVFAAGSFFAAGEDIGPDETAEAATGQQTETADDNEEADETTIGETVLGYRLAEQFFDRPEQAMGEVITIRNRDFTVIGVLAEPAEGFAFSTDGQLASSAFLDFDTGRDMAGGVVNIIEIDALATDPENVDETVEAIRTALRDNHDGEEDFTVMTLEGFGDFFDTIFGSVAAFIAAIAGISLLVGGIGVANIMLVTVTERTREIGIRKAVGATRGHILQQFLIEAIVLSLIGGALGVLAAFGFAQVIEAQADIRSVFTPFAYLLALGVSLGVGIIFGIVPAFKAARKNPIDALRYE